MKSPQQIAEEKYPLPFTTEPVATQNCTCYTCQIARREGYIAGMQEREKEAVEFAEWCEMKYWQIEKGIWVKDLDEPKTKRFTTEQLFNLFKQDK